MSRLQFIEIELDGVLTVKRVPNDIWTQAQQVLSSSPIRGFYESLGYQVGAINPDRNGALF